MITLQSLKIFYAKCKGPQNTIKKLFSFCGNKEELPRTKAFNRAHIKSPIERESVQKLVKDFIYRKIVHVKILCGKSEMSTEAAYKV